MWSCCGLALYLKLQGLVSISAETVRRRLWGLGLRLIRPVLTVASPDPDYEAKLAELEEHKEQARRGEIELLFEDEVDLNLLPGIVRAWTRRGEQKKIPTPGQNQKRYGFGTVSFMSGHITFGVSEHKDSAGVCELVDRVMDHYSDSSEAKPVVMVMDNYGIHHSKKTQAKLDSCAGRLRVFYLPTYSPHLNLIELIWKHLRRCVTHNFLFDGIAALCIAVLQFIQWLTDDPQQVLSLIGNNA